ncbi:MAG: hypothetical protein ACTSRU_00770 [Candidatus Hodarchaeales archaeon]
MDILKEITDSVKDKVENGQFKEIVDKHVMSAIDDSIKDLFKWNGEAKKAIDEAIKDKFNLDLGKIDIAQFNLIATTIVEEQLNLNVTDKLKDSITEKINSITGVLDKKDWKLSEIVNKYISTIDKSYDGEMEDQYGELSLHVNEDRDYCWIRFDNESDKESYACKHAIALNKGKIFHYNIDNAVSSPFQDNNMNDFERFMFSLYANQVTIEVDNCDLEYYREDCH